MSRMHSPAHPGEVLKDGWPEDVTITAAAKQLGVTRAALSRILNGHAGISADMALRLQDWLGIDAEMWLRMQCAYDLWQAEHHRKRPRIEPLKRETHAAA
ncbi:HigA family addiction module antitoxin [Allochromatium palmeri]|jgi:antitoxin HigA-1|uniref:HigA family addiction module antidote protein n=1 Tax=Allochromatium palmeri TaxID=231048 RepID=A0A6N8EBH6_9GAMM|nr:HigA family addiction module antitoxin [Allochromatium palmeri]MTW19887.1 HigA family addiction module antidote protein [Allochromatium palmeri]